jgi:phage tail-like protein
MSTPTASNSMPLTATSFIVSVDGVNVASFSELGGINSEVEHVEYISSNQQGAITHQRLYGKTTPPTVTLKRGMDSSNYMWAWHERVRQGDPTAPTTCQLQICGPDRKPQLTYTLENAWPRKVELSAAGAGKSETIVETVTLICDDILGQDT